MNTVSVRFAPSPTGIPHVGNIRTALFNYFFAKANKGKFILRIEDTDQARKVEGAVEQIQKSLTWLGVVWDEFYVQSDRLSEYKKYAEELVSKGFAKHEQGAVRFLIPQTGSTSWIDGVGNKKIEFQNKEIEDFIILKKDGFPTYHLANVVDDHESNISHVIRGEDWISSGPKHILLYKSFGWIPPVFVHVPNILGKDGKKLSKRRGAKSVLDFKNDGTLPDALLNYLMLLGWSPKNDREILSKQEIIEEFSLEKINAAPSIFDETKLSWMNGEYIRKLQISDFRSAMLEFDPLLSSLDHFEQYLPLLQTRIKKLSDFRDVCQNLENTGLNDKQKLLAKELRDKYRNLDVWKEMQISTATISVRDKLGANTKDVYTVLTGKPQGIPFEKKLEIDGKEKTLAWLEKISQ